MCAILAELTDKTVRGKNTAPSNYTITLDIGGHSFLLTSSGYTLGVPLESVEELKEMLEKFYRIAYWEVIEGQNGAKRSIDFELDQATSIAGDLTVKALIVFLEGETRPKILELTPEVSDADY